MASNQQAAGAAAARIVQLLKKQQDAFLQAAYESQETIRNEIVKELSKSASPSAPGQPPGVRTGILRNSAFAEIVAGGGTSSVSIDAGARAPYAGFLEFGTSKMAPRPYLRPAIARAAPMVHRNITARVRAVLP